MGIGMAFAEKYLSEKYSQLPGLIDHYTYIVVGDGDIQEGISYESMNIASLLKLNKVIVVHDSNDYQLDSSVELVNKENLKLRLESQN
jgi:transketolase